MRTEQEFNIADLEVLLRKVRIGSPNYITNVASPPATWSDMFRRALRLLISHDYLVVFVHDEALCSRLFFAGDQSRLIPVLTAVATLRSCAIDIIARTSDAPGIVSSLVEAGFSIHAILRRLSRTAGLEFMPKDPALQCESAQLQDADAIYNVLLTDFDPLSDRLPSHNGVLEAIAAGHLRLVRADGSLGGFLWNEVTGITSTIRYWWVHQHLRRCGTGGHLMRDYAERTRYCARHLLWVRDNNRVASACYEHYGYMLDGLHDTILTLNTPLCRQ